MAEPKHRNKVRIMNGGDVYGYDKTDVKTIRKYGQKRFVWKEKHNLGKQNEWAKAIKKAYAKLRRDGVIGKKEFVKINKGVKGRKLYQTAHEYYK